MKNRKWICSLLLVLCIAFGLFGTVLAAEETGGFSDVPDDASYAEAVAYVREQGLMVGTGDTTFSPDAATTRGQLVTILYRAAGCPTVAGDAAFPDVADTAYYADAAGWASANNIVSGYTDGNFGPDDLITCQQFITILWRYAGSPGTGEDSSEDANAMAWAGMSGIVGDTFDPQSEVSRAQAAVLLYGFFTLTDSSSTPSQEEAGAATLLYMGQGSLRIVTAEGKVIYIDPFSGDQYDLPADLILVTHGHPDHNRIDLIETQNDGCRIITHEEALQDGTHQIFDLGYVIVEAVEAGYNQNHDVTKCVGYILTFRNGRSVYVSGDTSTTEQMPALAEKGIDYAFFCCDGRFNMDTEEASTCAELVGAKHSIPYHMAPGGENNFNREIAEQFQAEGRIILEPGEELTVE